MNYYFLSKDFIFSISKRPSNCSQKRTSSRSKGSCNPNYFSLIYSKVYIIQFIFQTSFKMQCNCISMDSGFCIILLFFPFFLFLICFLSNQMHNNIFFCKFIFFEVRYDFAISKHSCTITDKFHLIHSMGNKYNSNTLFFYLFDITHKMKSFFFSKRCCWFVKNQNLGLCRQCFYNLYKSLLCCTKFRHLGFYRYLKSKFLYFIFN